jgi:hypothetical protein
MVNRSQSDHEKDLMYHRGTLWWSPTPNVLLTTAQNDLVKMRTNARVRSARTRARRDGAKASHQGREMQTGFLPEHVRDARTPLDVLLAALKGIEDGKQAKRVETRYLYDKDTILKAIGLAQKSGDGSRQDHSS